MKYIIVASPSIKVSEHFAKALGYNEIIAIPKYYPYPNFNPEVNSAEEHTLAQVKARLRDDFLHHFYLSMARTVVLATVYQEHDGGDFDIEKVITGALEILPRSILKDTIQIYVCTKHGFTATCARFQMFLKNQEKKDSFYPVATITHIRPLPVPEGHTSRA